MPPRGGSELIAGAEGFGLRATDGGLRPPPPVQSSRAECQPGRRLTRDPSTRPAAEMPSRTRYKPAVWLRSYRRRQRAWCWTVPAPSSPSRQTFPPLTLPRRQWLPSSDFPSQSMPSSPNLPWQQAPARRRRRSHRSRARRQTWSGSRLALRARSRPGEFQFARPAHWECRAVRSCQAPGGARRSCALAQRQSRSPRGSPPSPSQNASPSFDPYSPGHSP